MVSSPLRQVRAIAMPVRSLPKGWYWIAAFAISLSLWWMLVKAGAIVVTAYLP
jgi:hypothetical protein